MEYLDFVTDNYVWFLVGGIILLMTLIGYFAEKTQFGKKTNNKKEKTVEKTTSVKPVVVPSPQEQSEEVLFESELPKPDAEPETVEEEPMEDLDSIEIQEPTQTMDDWNTEAEEVNAEENTSDEEIPEELYAGLDGTPNTYKESKKTEDLDMDLPNIDDLKTDIDGASTDDANADDDIWRF